MTRTSLPEKPLKFAELLSQKPINGVRQFLRVIGQCHFSYVCRARFGCGQLAAFAAARGNATCLIHLKAIGGPLPQYKNTRGELSREIASRDTEMRSL
jgi:hypothetical protein